MQKTFLLEKKMGKRLEKCPLLFQKML